MHSAFTKLSVGIECQANQVSATNEDCNAAWGICNVRLHCDSSAYSLISAISQARIPFPLHLAMAQDQERLSFGQPRVGIAEVRQTLTGANFPILTPSQVWTVVHLTPSP